MKKQGNKKILGWIFNLFKKFIPHTVVICIISVLISLSYIWLAFLSKNILEIATGEKTGNFTTHAVLILLIIVSQIILSAVSSFLKAVVSGKFTFTIREYLFSLLNQKKYSLISQYHSGDILNRFTSDTGVIVSNTTSIIPDICSMLTKIIGGTIALVALEPIIAVIILVFGILVPAFGRLLNKRYKHFHKECQRTEGVTSAFLQECFENNIVIKTFKSEVPFIERLKKYMTDNYNLKIKRACLSIFSSLGLYFFFTIGYYAVLIWGASKISTGILTFGTLVAFLQLISQIRAPLKNVSSILPRYYSTIASAERLVEFENLESEPKPNTDNTDLELEYIKCEDLSFSYGESRVLNGFNCKINKGDITAITGPSGSGKSTLFKLMLGLFDIESGKITINDSINADAATRHLFAYVPQGNMILSGSIKDNLTMCNPQIPLDDIITACKTAQIHDYIASLENGYDTLLTERGGGLSEGQIQRLSIARALLANTPVLLLDEATSALDEQTELAVLKNIKALTDKTVLLVTHRKTSISFCDNIINI